MGLQENDSRLKVAALVLGLALGGCSPSGGHPIRPAGQPRIVSLTPSLTELLFALEAGPQVVGVTANDHFPPQVESLPEVGDLQLNYEALLSLHPDLVIYDPALNQQHLPKLQKLGLHLQPLSTQSLAELLFAIPELGRQLHREPQAQALVEHLQQELERARERASRGPHPRAVVEIWHEPLTLAGQSTYVSELIELAGFRNALTRPGYPTVDLEELLRLDPEVLILTHPIARQLASRPAWKQLSAVRQQRIVEVPEDWLVRPGPRLIDALHRLQDWLEKQPR